MEQVKPFHVPQECQNAIVFYVNSKSHIPSITVKWGRRQVREKAYRMNPVRRLNYGSFPYDNIFLSKEV
jgi:hypothetical protein